MKELTQEQLLTRAETIKNILLFDFSIHYKPAHYTRLATRYINLKKLINS